MAQSQTQSQTESPANAPLGELPEWQLADLYAGMDDPQLRQDWEKAEAEAKSIATTYQGKLAALSGAELARSIARYEANDETLSKIMAYAQLLYSGDQTDAALARFYQSCQERMTAIANYTLFFTLELNRIDEAVVQKQLMAPELQKYAAWLRDLRVYKPHQLADDLEKLLHEKRVSGKSAWNRLFDETLAEMRFPLDGKDLTEAEILNLLVHKDRATRAKAASVFAGVLQKNIRLFAFVTNILAKDKEIEDNWRGFKQPISSRNLSNLVEDEVVEALVTAVKASYPKLSHRYYRLKAKWLGMDKMAYYDRNAPLPAANDRPIPWAEARQMVESSYRQFSPELGNIVEGFFDKNWIDAPARPGKASGAFAHPTVPSAHPYILMNYQGKKRDVMTLAHELGHGVHQVLAGRAQGHFLSDTPLTLAETASVFGEMLTFQNLLQQETDPAARKILLAGKVEDMLNTVVRQIAFCEFERAVHAERRGGELSSERLGEIWLSVQRESLGDAFEFAPEYQTFWAYIPHFIHTPFYVYAYAFGDCLVNSLYAVYQQSDRGFAEKYLALLQSGGSKRHQELLAPFGLDASQPDFWHQGLNMLSGFIDELERL
jgi:oligoendopeptidase F